MAQKKYIVQEGQNIYDVALQNYGTLDELFTIFVDNPNLTINDDLTGLQEVFINTEIVGDQTIKNNYITTSKVTNNADANFVPFIDSKQFEDGEPVQFEDGEIYQFN